MNLPAHHANALLAREHAVSDADHSVLRDLLAAAAAVDLPDWHDVAPHVATREFEAGECIFAEGAVHPEVYVVRRGLIKLGYVDAQGREWIKSFVAEGKFFASMAALAPGGRAGFSAHALEASTVERLGYAIVARMAGKHLAWARALGTLAMHYAALKETRERELLMLDAKSRYEALLARSPDLVSRVKQKDLALHLGVTPVGLNRIIARVRRGG